VLAEDNYDGPDSYYCFDKKGRPPIGPDDAESDEDGKGKGGDAPPSPPGGSGARLVAGEDGHEGYSRRAHAALGVRFSEDPAVLASS
jgi:hypothetical protein